MDNGNGHAAMDRRGDDERGEQRTRWSNAASTWNRMADYISANTRPVTDQMLEMLAPMPGERVLDLAGGMGDPSLRMAEMVRPGGEVLVLDISPAMVQNARERAQALRLDNIQFRVIERETDLGVPAGYFDAATCRFGLMFMPDPVAALEALRTALSQDGRLAVATWGPTDHNPWPPLWYTIIGRHAETGRPLSMQPQWLAVSTFDGLEGVMVEAGFEDVQTVAVEVIAARGDTPAELWDIQCEVSAGLRDALAPLSDEQRVAIREDAIQTIGEMFGGEPPVFKGEALVSAGVNGDR